MMKKTVTIEGMRTRVLSLLFQAVFLCALPLMVNGQDCLYDTEDPTIDCNTAAVAQNLLINSSFETNNGHNTQGASDWTQFGPVFILDQNETQNNLPVSPAEDGEFYVKMFGGNSGLFQDIPVNGGDNLTGTVFMQNASFDPTNEVGGGQIKLEWIGAPGVETSPVFTALNPQDVWTEVTINTVAPAGATGVRFVIICNQPEGGAIMYDNASLLNTTQTGDGLVGDVTVSNDPGACGAELELATPATADNCSVVSVTNDYNGTGNASGFYPIGTTTVTWTVMDDGLGPLPDIALLSATGGVPNAESDIVAKLTATGAFNSISTIDVSSDFEDGIFGITPTLAMLQQYDAVLVWNDDPFQNEFALGDVLAAYVDAGGGVVVSMFTQWSPSNFDLQGDFRNNGYLPLDGNASPFAAAGPHTLSIVNGAHPIMQGVASFNGGSSSFRGDNVSLQPGASPLANWSTGDPLIAYKEPTNGRTVSLNFYPPSSNSRSDLWNASTDGDVIMANSLLWAAGHESTGNTATCSVVITVTDDEVPTVECSGPQDLLANSSFETNTGHDSPGAISWTQFGPVFILDQNVLGTAQDGDFYAKIFGGNSGIFQDLPVSAGDNVTGTVYMQNASFDPTNPDGGGQIKLEWIGAPGVETSSLFTAAAPQDVWTEVSVSAIAPPGATGVRFVLSCVQPSGGAIMFDNASMTATPPNPGLFGDVIVDNDLGECGAQLQLAIPVSGDNCPGAVLINDYNGTGDASDFYPAGTTTVNWTVTDAVGLTSSCSLNVTVNDTVSPTISCPSDITVYTDAGSCDATGVDLGMPSTSDNCADESATSSSSGVYTLGTNTVTWTVTDASGNTATCDQIVTVLDNPTVSISSPQDGIDGEFDDIVSVYIGSSSVLNSLGVTDFADLISSLDADCPDAVSYQWQYQNLGDDTAPIAGEWVDTLGIDDDVVINASTDHDFHHAYRVVITNTAGEEAVSNFIRVYSIDTTCKGPNKVKICMVPNGNPDNAHEVCVNINAVDAILENSPGSFLGPCDPDFKSITQENLEPEFTVYPNPTNSQLFINYLSYVDNNTVIELYNSNGELIKEVFNGKAKADQKLGLNFNMREFSDGMYLLRLIDSSGVLTKRVILTR